MQLKSPTSYVVTKPDLQEWITYYKADITEIGAVSVFCLLHTVDNQAIEQILSVGHLDDKTPEQITDEIWGTASNDANNRLSGLPQRYVVQAFREESDEDNIKANSNAEAQVTFNLTSKSPLASNKRGRDTEPANETGLLGQLMRQNESLHQMQMTLSESTAGRLANDLVRERNMRVGYEEQLSKIMAQQQDLLDRSFERDQKRRELELQAARTEKLLNMAASFAPLILSKFLGSGNESSPQLESASGGKPARDIAIAQFLSTLNTEQVTDIMKTLEPEQQTFLMALYQDYKSQAESENSTSEPVDEIH